MPQGAPREPQGRPKEPQGRPKIRPEGLQDRIFFLDPPEGRFELDLGPFAGQFGDVLIRFGTEVRSKLSHHVCNFEVLLFKKYVKAMFFLKPWGHAGYGHDLFH